MSLQAAIIAELKDTAGVTALVSTRVYGSLAPSDSAFPRIMMQQAGGSSEHYLGAETDKARASMQIVCWGTTIDSAHAVAEQVRLAISGKRGTFGTGGNTIVVESCIREGRYQAAEDPEAGEEVRRAVGIVDDYSFIYRQPTS